MLCCRSCRCCLLFSAVPALSLGLLLREYHTRRENKVSCRGRKGVGYAAVAAGHPTAATIQYKLSLWKAQALSSSLRSGQNLMTCKTKLGRARPRWGLGRIKMRPFTVLILCLGPGSQSPREELFGSSRRLGLLVVPLGLLARLLAIWPSVRPSSLQGSQSVV